MAPFMLFSIMLGFASSSWAMSQCERDYDLFLASLRRPDPPLWAIKSE